MDEHKSPQDFLNEIFEKGQAAPPSPPPLLEQPPGDGPPPASPTGGPAEKRGTEASARLLPWLGLTLGAALLVLAVCLLQLVRMGRRLDGLQQAVEAVQSVDDLRKETERLQEQLDQREQAYDQLWQALDTAGTQSSVVSFQKRRLECLWYMGQFMEHGDYPMAALAAVLSAQGYFPDTFIVDSQAVYLDPEQTAQYRAYCQELVERGYLEETVDPAHIPLDSQPPPTRAGFAEQWDPEQNPDMAALGILWCALDEYYVAGGPGIAAQHLIRYQWYPLGESEGDCYPQRILDTAGEYTIRQYRQLIQDLIDAGLVVEKDGLLDYSEGLGHVDVLYDLPFDPPVGYFYGEASVEITGDVIPGD